MDIEIFKNENRILNSKTRSYLTNIETTQQFFPLNNFQTEISILVHCAKEEEWLNIVSKSLHPGATYVKISLVRLIGMMLMIFVKQDHVHFVKNISVQTVNTGYKGKIIPPKLFLRGTVWPYQLR